MFRSGLAKSTCVAILISGFSKERAEMLQSPIGVVFKDLHAEMGEH